MDLEERRRRRQQKAAQRQAARKRLFLRLGIAGALLLTCLIFILIISLNGSAEAPPAVTEPPLTEPVTSAPADPEAETLPQETQPPETVIHFMAAGDLNVTDRLVASGGSSYDYSQTFLDIAHLLADADLTTVNLEGNFCGAPYGSSASAPQDLALTLRKAGVDMIQLANSYAIHRGISGLHTTIDTVRQSGMEPVGVFKNANEYNQQNGFTLFEVQGVRVAVVAFTKGMDGTTLPPGNENCVNILYSDYDSVYQKINRDKINQVMDAVNLAAPDITIALLHWGSEFNDAISSSQKTIRNLLLETGVDAIIGTHPHYVQEIQYDPQAGTLVAFSLGDFASDADRAGSEYSILLQLEITKNNIDGTCRLTGYEYIPIFSVAEEGKPTRILRIREAMAAYETAYLDAVSKETYDAMAYALMRIEQRVAGNA